jgi:DNA-directed RNA polymerase subunit RPC12/RpoP
MIDKDLLKNLTDEQKQALLEQLMASLSEPKQEEVAVEEPEETTDDKNDFTMHKSNSKPKGRREPVKFKKNAWQDDGLEFSDMETPKVKRTPRNRKKSQKVSVECHVCGKEFQVNSNLVYGEYHRCNRCGGR